MAKPNPSRISLAEIEQVLAKSGLVIPVTAKRIKSGWEILCKQVPGREKVWLQTVDNLLRVSIASSDDLLIARRYLLKDGKMVFGWFLRFQAGEADTLFETTQLLANELKVELQEEKAPAPAPTPKAVVVQRPHNPRAPVIRVIQRSQDGEGNLTEITEMPIPHVNRDLNIPTKPTWNEELGRFVGGKKGATYVNKG